MARVASRTVVAFIAAAVLITTTAACGGQSDVEKASEDVSESFAELDVANAQVRLTSAVVDDGDLYAATDNLIDVVRNNVDVIGSAQAKRELADAANAVEGWCESCVAQLDRERDLIDG